MQLKHLRTSLYAIITVGQG